MININQYITEKLKLNKNIKFDKNFKKGERFVTLSINLRYDNKNLEIKIYEPFTIDKIDYNKVTYTVPGGKTLTHDIKLNSNDYWEIVISDHFRGIMFKITDAIVFLHELIDNIYILDNETLCKYFDEEDKELINNEKYTLDRRYYIKELKEILNQIETEDYDVTEKLHLTKDNKDNNGFFPYEKSLIKVIKDYLTGFLHYKYDEDYELKLDDNKILIHLKYNFSSEDAVYMIGEKLLEKIQQEYLHNNSINYKNIKKSYPAPGIIQIEVNE